MFSAVTSEVGLVQVGEEAHQVADLEGAAMVMGAAGVMGVEEEVEGVTVIEIS